MVILFRNDTQDCITQFTKMFRYLVFINGTTAGHHESRWPSGHDIGMKGPQRLHEDL
jgi:hypothetical protein